MQTLLIATHNPGKVREFRALLADLPLRLLDLKSAGIATEVDETGVDFVANAVLKAETYARLSGLWTWADDSGLAVDALDGRPGVHSARFGGSGLSDAQRVQHLLHSLVHVAPPARTAHFHCVVALVLPPQPVQIAQGLLTGRIIDAPQGENGFGYDPVFFVPELQMTLAQALPEVKNKISHRAQASRAAKEILRAGLATLGE